MDFFCPICSGNGWYFREVRIEDGIARNPVLRVKCCGCNKTHIVLPDFLSPHKQYTQQILKASLHAWRRMLM